METAHYELIRLTIELIELYPYTKGNALEIFEVSHFEKDWLVESWEAYLEENTIEELEDCRPADGVDEEIKIIKQATKYLKEVKKCED